MNLGNQEVKGGKDRVSHTEREREGRKLGRR